MEFECYFRAFALLSFKKVVNDAVNQKFQSAFNFSSMSSFHFTESKNGMILLNLQMVNKFCRIRSREKMSQNDEYVTLELLAGWRRFDLFISHLRCVRQCLSNSNSLGHICSDFAILMASESPMISLCHI